MYSLVFYIRILCVFRCVRKFESTFSICKMLCCVLVRVLYQKGLLFFFQILFAFFGNRCSRKKEIDFSLFYVYLRFHFNCELEA